MRSIKNTSISFGMVSVPVKMYSAVSDHDLKLNQFHADCGGGVGYVKQCKHCDEKLDSASIVKGTMRDDVQVIVTDDDLSNLDVTVGPQVTVEQFIKQDEIDPIALEAHYFIAPSEASALEGFSMLHTVLEESHRVAVVRFVMRRSGSVGKEHLGILRPYGRALVIDTISWSDEIRKPEFSILDTPVKLNPKVLDVARSLVDAMTEPWNPLAFNDTFTEQLSELIAVKAAGGTAPKAAAKVKAGGGDLLSKLEASAATRTKRAPAKKAAIKAVPQKKVAPPAKPARVAKKTVAVTRSRKAVA